MEDVILLPAPNLETLLKNSDIIAVTVPLTEETDNLLTKKEFSLLKNGAILVSISPEKIINKVAVLEALNSGKLSGYGFDLDIMNPIPESDPLLNHKRVVITPHTASMTEEADKGYIDMAVENIKAFVKGKPIRVVE